MIPKLSSLRHHAWSQIETSQIPKRILRQRLALWASARWHNSLESLLSPCHSMMDPHSEKEGGWLFQSTCQCLLHWKSKAIVVLTSFRNQSQESDGFTQSHMLPFPPTGQQHIINIPGQPGEDVPIMGHSVDWDKQYYKPRDSILDYNWWLIY